VHGQKIAISLAVSMALTPVLHPAAAATRRGAKTTTTANKTTTKTATSRSSGTVLATVGNETITLKDLEAQIAQYPEMTRAQFQTPAARKNILDRMVQERVWLKAASATGFDKQPDIQGEIRRQTNSIILRGFFNAEVVARSKPTDEEIEKYYKDHPDEYTTPERISWRHIVTASEKAAESAKKRVQKGEDFEKVAKQVSIDPVSKDAGGWLGYITKGGQPSDSNATFPQLIDAAWKLPVKAVSDPIQTPRGWHIVRVESHDSSTVRPLESVRQSIEFKLSNDRSQTIYNQMLDSLKAAYHVKVLADSSTFEKLATGSGVKSARELFDLAQDTQDPKTRLTLYARVVKEYPSTDLAAQAQFMIGFVNSEEIHDYEAAESAFKTMMAKYPKSDLVDDAEWMLKNMRNQAAPDSIGIHDSDEEREREKEEGHK
jgi:peptidyl-prolyl cis-trans isomerase C